MKISRLPDGKPEIFETLQGEGTSLGMPCVFLRLSLCNLHCEWCDTPYTWNWEGTPWRHRDGKKFSREDQIIELDPEALAEILRETGNPNLVITGGEPLLQQDELAMLLGFLPEVRHVEIETNGTCLPTSELERRVQQFNVSPKLANSGMEEKTRLREEVLRFFAQSEKARFKFVVTGPEDLEEVLAIQKVFGIPSGKISLMPEGRGAEGLLRASRELVEACLGNGFFLTPRLHVLLWGDERGR